MGYLVVLILLCASCAQTNTQSCSDGRVCPEGTHCDVPNARCISEDQELACSGMQDGDTCMVAMAVGECVSGACIIGVCGDGIRTGNELCEGDDLGDATCESVGFYKTTTGLRCNAFCRYDTSGCAETCGDGVVNGTEQCDPAAALTMDCTSLGFYDAPGLACTDFCTWDTNACAGRCGDGVVQGAEVCDGAPPQNGCTYYQFDYGALGCELCGPEFSGCGEIGWRNEQVPLPASAVSVMGGPTGDLWVAGSKFAAQRTNGAWSLHSLPNTFGGHLWVRNATEVLSAGSAVVSGFEQPAVEHFDGTTWQQELLPSVSATATERISSLSGLASGEVFASSSSALYLLSGSTWTRVATDASFRVIWAASLTDVWIARVSDIVRWNGSTLTPLTGLPAQAPSVAITLWGADPTHVFLGFSIGIAVLNGSAWSWVPTPYPVRAIHGQSATDVIATGDFGMALRYDGVRWHDISVGSTIQLASAWDGGRELAAMSTQGLKTLDGSAWQATTISAGTDGEMPDEIWATDGAVFVTSTIGLWQLSSTNAWIQPAGAPLNELGPIWGFAANDLWTVGYDGKVHHYNGTWQNTSTVGGQTFDIWGTSSTDLFLARTGGSMLNIDRGNGTTWTSSFSLAIPTTSAPVKLAGTSSSDVWAVFDSNLAAHWNGTSWSTMTVPGITRIKGAWAVSATNMLVVGDGGAIVAWNGSTWTAHDSGTLFDLTAVWGTAGDDLFAVGSSGQVHHYDGVRWSPVKDPRTDYPRNVRAVFGTADHVYFARENDPASDVLYRYVDW